MADKPVDVSSIIQQAIASYASSGGGTGAGSGNTDPQLFFGRDKPGTNTVITRTGAVGKVPLLSDHEERRIPALQEHGGVMTLSEAQMQWYHWSQDDRLAWAKKAYALGYLASPLDVSGAQKLYMSALDESVRYFGAGKSISPWDVLDLNAGSNADALKKRGQVNPDGSVTRTNSSIDLSDKLSVQALATQVLHQALGRDPTDSEINTYYNTIRSEEKSHPTVQKVTTSAAGDVTQTSSGGFGQDDAQQLLQNQVQNDPEFGKYQSGTTYFQAAMSALGAIGGA